MISRCLAFYALVALGYSHPVTAYDRCFMEGVSTTTSRCVLLGTNITLECEGSKDKPSGVCRTASGELVDCILKEVGLREPKSTWCEISLASALSDKPSTTVYSMAPQKERQAEPVVASLDYSPRVMQQLKDDRASRADILKTARQTLAMSPSNGARRAAAVLRGMGSTVGHVASMTMSEQQQYAAATRADIQKVAQQAAAMSRNNGGLLFEAVYCCLQPRSASVNQSRSTAPRSAINAQTGEVYPGVAGGVINPKTGQFYPEVSGGYIDPKTGQFMPKH